MSSDLPAPTPRRPKDFILFSPSDSSSSPAIHLNQPTSITLNTRRPVSSSSHGINKATPSPTPQDARRRIHSVDMTDRSPSRKNPVASSSKPRHSVSGATSAGVFSDEYDLSHEDPRILKDVERALKLKARREARIKAGGTSIGVSNGHTLGFDNPATATFPPPFPSPTRHQRQIFPQEGISESSPKQEQPYLPPHQTTQMVQPTPISSNGTNLDWGGSHSESERSEKKWTLSIGKPKRKIKESIDHVDLALREASHEERLQRIRTLATPSTKAKVASLKEQLSNRYTNLENHLRTQNRPLNLAEISRWWGGQNTSVRAAITKAEPFMWLKNSPAALHSRWFLTSLMIREYFAFKVLREDPMVTIHEDASLDLPIAPHTTVISNKPPTRVSSPRRRSVDTGYASVDMSPEPPLQDFIYGKRQSADGSLYSSNFSNSSLNKAGALSSPSSSRHYLRETYAIRRRNLNDSEDGLSSAQNSVHERSEDSATKFVRELSPEKPTIAVEVEMKNQISPGLPPSNHLSIEQAQASSSPSPLIPSPKPSFLGIPSPRTSSFMRHQTRLSLPSEDVAPEPTEEEIMQQEAAEERARHEYEVKTILLEETIGQNQRIRHVLNRIALAIREFDAAQSNFVASVDRQEQSHVPPDVLEALGHDPANVTGATRKYRCWRAVEDIHARLTRQRETLEAFLANASPEGLFRSSILEDPIDTLLGSLDSLEIKKAEIVASATEVSERLDEVRKLHATVKKKYNKTLEITSVVYPEISNIVALVESYKDQYQHFWDIGMDALTFVLDTVTPFWRTYGKTIGDDVRDFLIVPLYRNEFTGEAKRYSISRLPSRSFQHYVGLVLFFITSMCVCLLQGRAATTSVSHYRLAWIEHTGIRLLILPFFWVGIMIQWSAVLIEFSIVVMQAGMVLWWLAWAVKLTS